MNQGHLEAGEVINLDSLKPDMSTDSTYALIKTPDMEVIRMVIPAGRDVEEHSVAGEVSVQCLQGEVEFYIGDETKKLTEGSWVYLNRKQPHAMKGVIDAVLLVTILFTTDS